MVVGIIPFIQRDYRRKLGQRRPEGVRQVWDVDPASTSIPKSFLAIFHPHSYVHHRICWMRLRQRGFPLSTLFQVHHGWRWSGCETVSLLHKRLRVTLPGVRDRRKLYASGSNEKANQLPCNPSCVKMAVSVAWKHRSMTLQQTPCTLKMIAGGRAPRHRGFDC